MVNQKAQAQSAAAAVLIALAQGGRRRIALARPLRVVRALCTLSRAVLPSSQGSTPESGQSVGTQVVTLPLIYLHARAGSLLIYTPPRAGTCLKPISQSSPCTNAPSLRLAFHCRHRCCCCCCCRRQQQASSRAQAVRLGGAPHRRHQLAYRRYVACLRYCAPAGGAAIIMPPSPSQLHRESNCLYSENSASAEFQPVASHEIVQPQQELRT
jgi:hypothetical protein